MKSLFLRLATRLRVDLRHVFRLSSDLNTSTASKGLSEGYAFLKHHSTNNPHNFQQETSQRPPGESQLS